jgi:hypothetical protein
MNAKVFNLALMIFWLLLGLGLLTRELWMPPGLLEKVNGPQTPLAIALAGMLAAWNFIRFWAASRFGKPAGPSAQVQEYRRRIRTMSGEDPKVTNPEFNFDEPAADDAKRDGQ